MSWETLFARCDAIFGAGDSVSVFHLCGETTEQVWVKRRVDDDRGGPEDGDLDLEELLGVRAATAELHPVLGGDPVNCTEQQGVPGPWSERLPHFRSGFLPSSGEELQSEFFVARSDAVAAIEAVRGLAAEIVPLLLISELRTIAGDSLLAEPPPGARLAGAPFHLAPEAGRGRGGGGADRGRPGPVRARAPTGARSSPLVRSASPRSTRGWATFAGCATASIQRRRSSTTGCATRCSPARRRHPSGLGILIVPPWGRSSVG